MTLRDDFLRDERSQIDSADSINAIQSSKEDVEKASTSTGMDTPDVSTSDGSKGEALSGHEEAQSGREVAASIPLPSIEASRMSPWHEVMFVFNVSLAQILSLASLATTVAPVLVIGKSLGVFDLGQDSW